MKKKVIAAIGLCGLVLSSVSGMNIEYEVKNGLTGMKRDVVLSLANIMKNEDGKLKNVFGMCLDHYKWKTHSYYIEGRQSVLYKKPLRCGIAAAASDFNPARIRDIHQFTEWQWEYARKDAWATCLDQVLFPQLVSFVPPGEFLTYDNIYQEQCIRLSNHTDTIDTVLRQYEANDFDRRPAPERWAILQTLYYYPTMVSHSDLPELTEKQLDRYPPEAFITLLPQFHKKYMSKFSRRRLNSIPENYFWYCPEEEAEFYSYSWNIKEFNGTSRAVINRRVENIRFEKENNI